MSLILGMSLLALFSLLLMVRATRRNITIVRSDPLSFYKEQLDEIHVDVSAGMITEAEAENASLEIKRRIIKTGDLSRGNIEQAPSTWIFYAIGGLVIIGSMMLYSILGSPKLESRPSVTPLVLDQPIAEGSSTTFKQAIESIQLKLIEEPDDIKGWTILANTLASLRRHNEAADAYNHAMKLDSTDLDIQIKYGEQIMGMHAGQVVPAASKTFQNILKASPDNPSANFYLGLAQKQAGKNVEAKRIWQRLVDLSSPDAPWLPTVRSEIAALNPSSAAPGFNPSSEMVKAVNNMNAEDQAQFIDGMVAKLRDKLAENPSDANGWLMLARSEVTRGNKQAAIAALKEGLKSVDEVNKEPLRNFLKSLNN